MITLKNVTKSYVKDVKSVDNLNLEIKDGEVFGFLGPNGAGKTTTIKMITGILNPDEGEILIDNNDIEKNPIEAKKGFGFVPDNPDMFLNLKAIEYLNFIADIYGVKDRKEKIEEITKKFGLFDVLNNQIASFSHGMRQKIVICGALLHNPKNWILDEPMTGLDPKSAFELKEMMKQHCAEGNSVFFSTHVLDTAEKICDRVGIISKGKLIFIGTIEEMKNLYKDDSLEEVFLELTENA